MTNYINKQNKFTYTELFDDMFLALSKVFYEAPKNNLPGRLNIRGCRVLKESNNSNVNHKSIPPHAHTQKADISYNCKQVILIVIYL